MTEERLRDRQEDRIEDRRALRLELLERNVSVEAACRDERCAGRKSRGHEHETTEMGHGQRIPEAVACTDPKPFGDHVCIEDERPVGEHALLRGPCRPRSLHDHERVLRRNANATVACRLARLAAGLDRDRDRADQRPCEEVLDELRAVRASDLEPAAPSDPLGSEPLRALGRSGE
jgi:hypothetical protein